MSRMSIGELLTYLKALPKETEFPLGFGVPFIINNVTDQFIFRPRLGVTAEEMAESLENSLGTIVVSNTGAQSIIRREDCYAYFGLDAETPITPLNIIFLTILRSMERDYREITVTLAKPGEDEQVLATKFKVPATWWDTLSKKHQNVLALEYLANGVMGGLKFSISPEIAKYIKFEQTTNAFGKPFTLEEIDG